MADIAIERYGGADRYSTSLLIAEAVSEDAGGALDWAVLVSGLRWTDAVVAAPVAGALGAPLIMTPPDQLRADTARFLTRSGVSDVLIIGALDSVSGRHSVIGSRVVDGLRDLGIGVERVTGDDEYDTAVAAAAYLDQILRRRPEGSGPAGVMPGKGRTAIVASGHVFADALVAGPIAAHGRHPLLLTAPDRLHHQVPAYLRNAAVEHVVLMGGTAALSESVETSLRALGLDITRLAGATRFDTAVQAAELADGRYASGENACFGSRDIGIARARVPFDSFSAGPLLARLCAPLVLAEPTRVPDATADWLDDVRATALQDGIGSVDLRVFGGQAAVSDAALSSYLAATRLQASAPDAPERPSLSAGDGTVTASWRVPPSHGGPITAQQVRWRADGSWDSQQLIATATSYTISGLRDGTSYEVQVRARNNAGWSAWSQPASASTDRAALAPDAPSGVSASGGDGTVTVSWQVPSDNGAAITEQQVRWTPRGMTWDTPAASVSASATSYTISGLRNGTDYEVQVRARNSVGWGPWSAAAGATTQAQARAQVPDGPAGVSASGSVRQVSVSWQRPAGNGAAITEQQVRWNLGQEWTTRSVNASATSYTITGLRNSGHYEVQVRARNSVGWGAWSPSAWATTTPLPSQPAAMSLTRGVRQVSVTWQVPSGNGAAITEQQVRWIQHNTPGASWSSQSVSPTATSYTIRGLHDLEAYEVEVLARNSAGWGRPTSRGVVWTLPKPYFPPPDKPTGMSLSGGDGSVTVSWQVPSDNGDAIIEQEVRWRRQSTNRDPVLPGEWLSQSVSASATSFTIRGLAVDRRYQVEVRARNHRGGWGPAAWAWADTDRAQP